ncbi:hypothetical protein BDV38DRAFT_260829, partial [Aspergillus pseudotamarii]
MSVCTYSNYYYHVRDLQGGEAAMLYLLSVPILLSSAHMHGRDYYYIPRTTSRLDHVD